MCFDGTVHLLLRERLTRCIHVFCIKVSGSFAIWLELTNSTRSDGHSGRSGGRSVSLFDEMRNDSRLGQLIPTGIDSISLLLSTMRSSARRPLKKASGS